MSMSMHHRYFDVLLLVDVFLRKKHFSCFISFVFTLTDIKIDQYQVEDKKVMSPFANNFE